MSASPFGAGENAGQTAAGVSARPGALAVRLPGVVEHVVEKRDRDLVRWYGCPFDRPATTAERAFLAARGALSDPSAAPRLMTRVEVRGAVRRRTWPMLGGGL